MNNEKSIFEISFKLVLLLIYIFSSEILLSQQVEENYELNDQAIKVFLDVRSRFRSSIKEDIQFVNYVRDKEQANLYLMMITNPSGANGYEYTLIFIGQKRFSGENDTLKCFTQNSDSDEIRRVKVTEEIKKGLVKYVSKTPQSEFIEVRYKKKTTNKKVVDNWDFWVLTVDFDSDFDLEESEKILKLKGALLADRVTENSKFSMGIRTRYKYGRYGLDEEDPYTSITRENSIRALYVGAAGSKFSFGGFGEIGSSIYSNENFYYELAPAVEYNIFPYSEYTNREFRLLYRIGRRYVNYNDTTIYNKTEENLFFESLSATIIFKERWGSLRSSIIGSHFFHDFSKNRLTIEFELEVRVFEGFSFNFGCDAELIHDQLSLKKGSSSLEDILTRQKEIATQYKFSTSFGFRYSFGSIFSNVVNPRFGSRRY